MTLKFGSMSFLAHMPQRDTSLCPACHLGHVSHVPIMVLVLLQTHYWHAGAA